MGSDDEVSCGQKFQNGLSSFGKFIYNSEKGQVLGRTAKSWLLIIIFFVVYYILLAAFFVGMLSVLIYGIIDDKIPMRTGQHSLLKMNPGLGLRPQPDVRSTLVRLDLNDVAASKPYIDNINEFIKTYTNSSNIPKGNTLEKGCNFTKAQLNKDWDPLTKYCVVNPAKDWGSCNKANDYGFNKDGKPCAIVKMNRVYGWLPDIEDETKSNHTLLQCEGETDGDKALIGKIKYYPSTKSNGTEYGLISSALFPYLNQPGYTTPTVAVQFESIAQDVVVMVQCRLTNVKNIEFDAQDKLAMVHFEVLVYSKK